MGAFRGLHKALLVMHGIMAEKAWQKRHGRISASGGCAIRNTCVVLGPHSHSRYLNVI